MKRHWILFLMVAALPSLSFPQVPVEDEMYSYVAGIEGKTHSGREGFIKDRLRDMGVGYITAPFKKIILQKKDTVVIEGENIIARIGRGNKRIIVGAHYDAFAGSPGANDNGSGVAVALALINHLKDSTWNYAIDFCFFDQEEAGSVGASCYVQQFVVPKLHVAMINLNMEGSGDEVFVGPISNNNRIIMRYVHEAARKTKALLSEHSDYPATDFIPFSDLNLENISISVVPKGDGDRLSKYVQNGYKTNSIEIPQVLGLLHTPDDRSIFISPLSLKISFEFTETLLFLLNEAQFLTPPKELMQDR